MKITKNKLMLKVPAKKYLPSITNEIRENLERMGVNGLTIDVRYDVNSNVAMARFVYDGKNYEMRVSNQKDVRGNLYAISRRIEYKVRMHLLGIEDFDISVSPYLSLEDKSGFQNANVPTPKASIKYYATLGVQDYSSMEEIEKKYRTLVKSWHPDMAGSDEAKAVFEKKMAEINEAYTEIKKERRVL
jgi:hypothetical protein